MQLDRNLGGLGPGPRPDAGCGSYWGDRYVRDDPENIVKFRHSCGAELRPELRCAACGELLEASDVTSDREVHRSQVAAV